MAIANPTLSPNQMTGQVPSQLPSSIPSQIPGQGAALPQGQSIQLHDIHVPEQVSDFPIAPGWWILLVLIVITALWVLKNIRQKKQLNAVKNRALASLANNHTLSAKESITLLKWAAMHYFSRQQLAKLYGEGFQTFLIKQIPDKYRDSFTRLSTAGFQAQYQAEDAEINTTTSDVDSDCHKAAKLWLTHALPVKNKKELST